MKIQDVTEEDVYDMAVWMSMSGLFVPLIADEIRNMACQLTADAVGVGTNEEVV